MTPISLLDGAPAARLPAAVPSGALSVSVVIITHGRLGRLRDCLDSLAACAPPRPLETLVVLNGPDPETRRWLESAAAPEGVRWLESLPASKGRARNLGARSAKGGHVLFLDDDATVPPGFFRALEPHLAAADVLGGPNLTPPQSAPFQRAVGFVLGSPWGAGSMSSRYNPYGFLRPVPTPSDQQGPGVASGQTGTAAGLRPVLQTGTSPGLRPVLQTGTSPGLRPVLQTGTSASADDRSLMLCNLLVRRRFFDEGAAFPEDFFYNEENMLVEDLRLRGAALRYAPEFAVFHARREGWRAFLAQVWRSGVGRGHMTRLRPGSCRGEFLMPSGFLAYLAALPFLGTGWAWAPLALYAAATAAEAARAGLELRSFRAAFRVAGLLFGGHAAYGLGFVCGVFRPELNSPS
jgi:GT2 family glycosyltransferase